MPKKTLKRWLPHASTIKESKSLQFLGHLLHEPGLWHLNRKSVVKAVFIGLFIAMMPVPGQMVAATLVALWRNANLPISVTLVWITNPLTIPPIFYFNYLVGTWVLGHPVSHDQFTLTIEWISQQFEVIWWPLMTGSIINGLILALVGSLAASGFWHWHVRRSWRKRAMRHLKQEQNQNPS